jgi:hypothetical protein
MKELFEAIDVVLSVLDECADSGSIVIDVGDGRNIDVIKLRENMRSFRKHAAACCRGAEALASTLDSLYA